jgi:hypothetical protein
MLVEGTGYVYNVSSSSWRVVNNGYFGLGQEYFASADPSTGIVYIMNDVEMLSVDLRTNACNQSELDSTTMGNIWFFVWNEYLKGMIGEGAIDSAMYTPSKVSKSSNGWSQFVVSANDPLSLICGVAAYGGKKMVYLQSSGPVFTLDVVKKTWTKGPQGPGHWRASCAMTGDQFIIWGGMISENAQTNETFVFNVKTQKWISRYTAPPSRSTTTMILHTSQLTPTPTHNVQNATSSAGLSDVKIITIVVIVTGIVVAVNLWLIIRHRRAKRLNHEGSSTDSLSIKDDHASDSSGPFGRLHQGLFGARPLSEHPHATVKDLTPERNVQEGALEVHLPPQQPHAMVGKEFDPIYAPQQPHAMVRNEFDPMYSGKAIDEPTRYYGKAELEDQ